MPGLPVMLHLGGQKCLIVGGGAVALRRAQALIDAGCPAITVVAPRVDPALRQLPVTIHERPVRETDLAEVRLVVLATDDWHVNERIARQAVALGVLVNRADDALRSEITFMAQTRVGPITVAAHTGSALPDVARSITDEMRGCLSEHWPVLVEIAGPCRQIICQTFADAQERRARIAKLTDDAAIAMLQSQGREAYRAFCQSLCRAEADDIHNPLTEAARG